jgi:predicted TIM-barrel fold metal-dependent hydrolase
LIPDAEERYARREREVTVAKLGFRVLDSDMHVLEPPDLWQRYIDPAWRHAAPVGLTELRRDMRVKVKSHVVLRIGPVRPLASGGVAWSADQDRVFARAEERGWDAVSQAEAMDVEGLDQAVLFPSRGLFVLGLDTPRVMGSDGLEPELAAAIARAYNDWLADFCRVRPGRMYGAAMVPPHDVAAAVTETRRAVEQLGFRAIFLAPGCVDRRPWHDPYFDPLWAECERLDVPITFHGGGQTWLKPDFTLEVLDKLMMWHTFGQPLGVMMVAVSLTAGGVFERFPRLRAGLLEGNCSWAPWLFHRLDEHWEWVGRHEVPELRRRPSEYFRTNCYLAVEADETPVTQYVERFGDENLVFSTDYPHADSKYPNAVETFLKLPLSDTSKRRVLWDNCARLYGL